MADLTASSPSRVSGGRTTVELGATAAAGDAVYRDPATNTYKKAVNSSAAASKARGVLLAGGNAGDTVSMQTSGIISYGAGAVGVPYFVSANAGKFAAAGDLGSGKYTTLLGVGIGNNKIMLMIKASGYAQA
jgi:hypothetical protein